jgi:HK97 family phage portal protein
MNTTNFFYPLNAWIMGGLRRLIGLQSGAPNGYNTPAATPVTFDTAMQLSAVWACIKLWAELVSTLPISVYKVEIKDGKKIRTLMPRHPLSVLFSGKVNRYQTVIEFFETVILNLMVHGNAYCKITRLAGEVVALLPIMSAQVRTDLLADGSVQHTYTHDTATEVLSDNDVWHLKLMGNGVIGMSPLAFQRNSLGIALGAELAASNIYANGAKPSGVIEMDRILTKEQRGMVRENFGDVSTGADARLLVLEKGMKFNPVSMTPEDIELLASRQFQISDICRWYGVPSVLINDVNGSTVWGSGIEQIIKGFYKVALRPVLEKIELSGKIKLFTSDDRVTHEMEFNLDALTQADMAARFTAYSTAIRGAFMMPNQARAEEGWGPLPGGDRLYVQGATVPLTVEQEEAMPVGELGATKPGVPTEDVQGTALNGAQVTSLLDIVQAVADGLMPAATATGIIRAAFPALSEAEVAAMITPLTGFKPPAKPEPKPAVPPAK